MIASFLQKISKFWRAAPFHRPARVRLGFYGYRYRKARNRTSMVARCAIAAVLLFATIAAASEQFSR